MREYIKKNLKEINDHFYKRKRIISKPNKISVIQEYKEWGENINFEKELIWTLPDLTRVERFNNFCRSIKKKIN